MTDSSNLTIQFSALLARSAGWISKTFLGKSGETITGRVLLTLRPDAIRDLAKDRTVLLVSGTNGKTSTTRFLSKVVSQLGKVATSTSGSNLNWGIASALLKPGKYAVLEIDELHLPKVAGVVQPKVVSLLNLTRDQLHRMHEVKRVADRWREVATSLPETTFVADIDDPFVNYAASDAKKTVRVSFGGRSHPDGAVCPRCGDYLDWDGGKYSSNCGLTNALPDFQYSAMNAAERNAILANVAGSLVGAAWVEPQPHELERIVEKNMHGVEIRLRLTKNPASWTEVLASVSRPNVILILNAREVDGIDTSWLFDVSFEQLLGRRVVITGERALDMQYRLHVQGIEAVRTANFDEAVRQFPAGSQVDVLAAYTAFFELSA